MLHIKCGQKQVISIRIIIFLLNCSNKAGIGNYTNEENNDQQGAKVLN